MLRMINIIIITSERCNASQVIIAQVCVMKSLFRATIQSGSRQQSDHRNIRRLGGASEAYANSYNGCICASGLMDPILTEMVDWIN
jgi:hypothetical protein